MSIFKRMFSPYELDTAVEAILRVWFRTYLNQACLDLSDNRIFPIPRTYKRTSEFVQWSEDSLPGVIIVNSGVIGEPTMRGSGSYGAWWRITLGIIVGSTSQNDTSYAVKLYATAARALMVQNQDVGGIASGVNWKGETYDEGPVEKSRSLGVATVMFDIFMEDVVSKFAGPTEPVPPDPDDLPGSEWPVVEITETTVTLSAGGGP